MDQVVTVDAFDCQVRLCALCELLLSLVEPPAEANGIRHEQTETAAIRKA